MHVGFWHKPRARARWGDREAEGMAGERPLPDLSRLTLCAADVAMKRAHSDDDAGLD